MKSKSFKFLPLKSPDFSIKHTKDEYKSDENNKKSTSKTSDYNISSRKWREKSSFQRRFNTTATRNPASKIQTINNNKEDSKNNAIQIFNNNQKNERNSKKFSLQVKENKNEKKSNPKIRSWELRENKNEKKLKPKNRSWGSTRFTSKLNPTPKPTLSSFATITPNILLEDTFGTNDPNTSTRKKRKGSKINSQDNSNSVGFTRISMKGVDIDYSFPKPTPNNASKRKKKQTGNYFKESKANDIKRQSKNKNIGKQQNKRR